MTCLRIYETKDGESHFGKVDIPTKSLAVYPDATPFEVSPSYQASRVRFTQISAGMRQVDWRTVPERVLTARLDGAVEYETSDGEVQTVKSGGFVLVEDTHGKGHLSRHSPDSQLVLWITVPDGFDTPKTA